METATVLAALQGSYAFLKEVGGFAINERDRQKLAAVQIDLTDKIMQAQAEIIKIQDTIAHKSILLRAAQERISEMEGKQRERSRYELAKLGTVGDFFAYKLRAPGELTERANEPEHFLCQPCFDADKKSVLQIGKYTAHCTLCKTSVSVASQPSFNRRSAGWMGS